MNPALPRPVANYFDAANALSSEDVVAAFSEDAVVHDEKQTHRGRAEIRAWSDRVIAEYKAQTEVLAVSEPGEETIVDAKVSGTFPGSPVELRFHFKHDGHWILEMAVES